MEVQPPGPLPCSAESVAAAVRSLGSPAGSAGAWGGAGFVALGFSSLETF